MNHMAWRNQNGIGLKISFLLVRFYSNRKLYAYYRGRISINSLIQL